MEKIRIAIADDHALVREGFRSLLEAQPDIEVVGEAANGEEAVTMARDLQPDIILMDITMPRLDGLEATYQIKKLYPQVKILVLTMHEGDEFFFKFLDAGASGYFVKGGSSRELLWALKTVAQGEVFLYPSMATKLLTDYLQRVNEGNGKEVYDALSGRQKEILQLFAKGHTNQEIADILFLSISTVQTHRARIMAKLGFHRPVELFRYAAKRGFVNLDT